MKRHWHIVLLLAVVAAAIVFVLWPVPVSEENVVDHPSADVTPEGGDSPSGGVTVEPTVSKIEADEDEFETTQAASASAVDAGVKSMCGASLTTRRYG